MKTHAYVHRRVDRIEGIWCGKIWCGLFIYYSFFSPTFSKACRRLFVHTHYVVQQQHKHVLPLQHNMCHKQSLQVQVTSALWLAALVAAALAFCQPSLYIQSSAVTSFTQTF